MQDNAMEQAVRSAEEGITKEEGGPFGAAIVFAGQVIATGHNTVLKDHDPTCHAEMNVIRKASQHLKTHILSQCVLYTTAEPCPMCMGAILWARIPKIVIGVDRQTAAQYGFDDAVFYEQLQLPHADKVVQVEVGCSAQSCEAVFKKWQAKAGILY